MLCLDKMQRRLESFKASYGLIILLSFLRIVQLSLACLLRCCQTVLQRSSMLSHMEIRLQTQGYRLDLRLLLLLYRLLEHRAQKQILQTQHYRKAQQQ